MKAYAIKAKLPKKAQAYFNYFKREVLNRCIKNRADCVIEYLDGKILLFTDYENVKVLLSGLRGVISYHPVRIFENFDSLVDSIEKMMNNCGDFAIRSNRKFIERDLGAKITEYLKISVNLRDPQCLIYVEKRGKIFLLFEDV